MKKILLLCLLLLQGCLSVGLNTVWLMEKGKNRIVYVLTAVGLGDQDPSDNYAKVLSYVLSKHAYSIPSFSFDENLKAVEAKPEKYIDILFCNSTSYFTRSSALIDFLEDKCFKGKDRVQMGPFCFQKIPTLAGDSFLRFLKKYPELKKLKVKDDGALYGCDIKKIDDNVDGVRFPYKLVNGMFANVGFYRKRLPKLIKFASKYDGNTLFTRFHLRELISFKKLFDKSPLLKKEESVLSFYSKLSGMKLEDFHSYLDSFSLFNKLLLVFESQSKKDVESTIVFSGCLTELKDFRMFFLWNGYNERRAKQVLGPSEELCSSRRTARKVQYESIHTFHMFLSRAMHICMVCGVRTRLRCPHCNFPRYCSEKCQKDDWENVHKGACGGMFYKKRGNTCEVCNKPATKCCSKCKIAYYCSRNCQKKDWKRHKLECGEIVKYDLDKIRKKHGMEKK